MRISALVAAAAAALLIAAAPAGAAYTEYRQDTDIAVPEVGDAPVSERVVQGAYGLITDINVLVGDPVHNTPNDFDIYLRSPSGTSVLLISDACGGVGGFENGGFKLDQDGVDTLSPANDCSGKVAPPKDDDAIISDSDASFPTPVETSLDVLNGENPNGTWTLHVTDDEDHGSEANSIGFWAVEIEVAPASPIPGSSPLELDVLSSGQILTDVDVVLDGMSHSRAEDLDMFLEGPGGQKTWLISDACWDGVNAYWTDLDFDISDEAAFEFPPFIEQPPECDVLSRKPTNHHDGGSDTLDFPAEAGPPPAGAKSLSTFDLTDPDGVWRLWMAADNEGSTGFLNGFDLRLETRLPADVGFPVGAQTAPEGSTVTVDVVRSAAAGGLGRGSITVATSSGTAQAGADFEPVSQILTFEPGETTKSISVPVFADGQGEPEQGFSIMLGQAEGDAKAGTPSAVGVTIPGDAQGPRDDTPVGDQVPPPPGLFRSTNVLANPPSTRCRRRGETIRFRPVMPSGVGIVRSEVWINGKKVEDNIGAAAIAPIVVTMTGKRMKVRIRLTSHDGRKVNIRRTFRRCATRKRR